MHPGANIVGIAALLVLIAGPLLLGLAGLVLARDRSTQSAARASGPWRWKPSVISALLYTLAFNLTFFIQELFLVLPKAFTPGLRPTLFHNNHHWDGDHPLASLFQGTGALATLIVGLVCALLAQRFALRSASTRLFLIWMAYCGCFMALPQVVVGALSSGSDVGMAMDFFHLGTTAKVVAALVALALMPPIALWLTRSLLGLAERAEQIGNARARTVFVLRVATVPALIAIALIVPFRVPREVVEVVVLPIVVMMVGVAWMQAGAWRMRDVDAQGGLETASIAWPLAAVLLLLLIFQCVLRPGIPFY
jgi:hypothetical protein